MYCYYMKKKRKRKRVAGKQDKTFGFRISGDLRSRFKKARKTGLEIADGQIVRPFLEHYADFTDANGRQPSSLEELYAWVLKKKK